MPNFRPSADLDYIGNINSASTIAGTAASTVVSNASSGAAAATNFNTRNDRNPTSPAAPTFSPSGEAVDHTLNTDGSANISFEWNYTLGTSPLHPNNIDGYIIYVKTDVSPASTASYTFGTSPAEEVTYTVDKDRRAFVLPSVSADRFYRFGIQAYRAVDNDILASGVVYSTIAKPPHSSESPYYRPATSIAFAGDITGTIAGSPASIVVANATDGAAAFTGTAEVRNTAAPTNNATIGTITSAATVDGNVVITVPITYTQSTIKADGVIVYYVEGATGANAKTNDHKGFSLDQDDSSTVRNVQFTLKPGQQYNFSVRAYRRAEGGRKYTTFSAVSTHTSTAGNYTGNINGSLAATVVSNASSGAAAATNFNTRNDRNPTSPAAPTFSPSGEAVDHTLNTDGSANISFEWNYTLGTSPLHPNNIDGYIIYVKTDVSPASTASYTFGTSPAEEVTYTVDKDRRAFVLPSVSADRFYRFGIQAYRAVDNDILASGVVYSTIAKPPHSSESPYYRPATSIAFAGDITGTIAGSPASIVVANATDGAAAFTGTAEVRNTAAPTNNATIGTITSAATVDGNVVITVPITYTQSTIKADGVIVYYVEGATGANAKTNDHKGFSLDQDDSSTVRNVQFTLKPGQQYNFSVRAYRRAEGGRKYTTFSAVSTHTSTAGNYTGNINGSLAATVVSNASSGAAAATNFNTRNDRNPTSPAAPTFSPSGEAVDHTLNTDGSANISFEWNYTLGTSPLHPNNIDGYIIYVKTDVSPASTASYTFGTSPAEEVTYTVDKDRRAFVLPSVSADRFYRFGIQAYRAVDNDILASGVVYSTIAKPPHSSESPYYRPATSIAFAGDITGTIAGSPASIVVANATDGAAAFTGTAEVRNTAAPTNNATIGTITSAATVDGNVVITVPITYTQSTIKADGVIVYYVEGATGANAKTNDHKGFSLDQDDSSTVRNVQFTLKPGQQYNFSVRAYRRAEGGRKYTTFSAVSTHTSTAGNYTGNINGSLAATVVSNASSGAAAATNFNTRNDRNPTSPAAPTFSPSGEAVDHTLNTDGSANISFEWNYTLGTSPLHPNNIDGYIIYVKTDVSPASTASYTFGTSPAEEVTYTVDKDRRAFVLPSVSADRFYRFGIQAYRAVDNDILASGVVYSTIAKPPHSSESPYYRPATSIAFAGDITGTIAGSPASIVVANATDGAAAFTGTAEVRNTAAPTNNATIGTITSAATVDGNVVITVPITYTQSTIKADGVIVYYVEGATGANAKTNDHKGFSLDQDDSSTVRNVQFTLKPGQQYNFSVRAYRRAEGGRKYTTFSAVSTHTSTAGNYTGNINGSLAATVVSNASSGAAAATNFNTRNDRNPTSPAAPTFSPSGEAVDHTLNTDGSANISFEWNYTLGTSPLHPNNIDGYIIYVKTDVSPASTASYTFGTSPAEEVTYTVDKDRRAFVLPSVSADRFYRFGIQAYRAVDNDILASGVVYSTIAKPPHSSESPYYRPATSIAFAGDITGTIAGSPASIVVANATDAFTGTTNYRSAGAPTNLPVPTGIVSTPNSNATKTIRISWEAYLQGAKQADVIGVFYRRDNTIPTYIDTCAVMNVNLNTPGVFELTGVNPADPYSFGIAAGRRTEDGIEWGEINTTYGTNPYYLYSASYSLAGPSGSAQISPWTDFTPNGEITYIITDDSVNYEFAVWSPSISNPTTERWMAEAWIKQETGTTKTALFRVYAGNESRGDLVLNPTNGNILSVGGPSNGEGFVETVLKDAVTWYRVGVSANISPNLTVIQASFYPTIGTIPSAAFSPDASGPGLVIGGVSVRKRTNSSAGFDWTAITADTVNFTGTIAGSTASTVVANATDGAAAFTGTTQIRSSSPPNGTLSLSTTTASTADGNALLTTTISLTQGSPRTDGIILYYSTSNAASPDKPHVKLDANVTSYERVVKPSTAYYIYARQYRKYDSGMLYSGYTTVSPITSSAPQLNATAITGTILSTQLATINNSNLLDNPNFEAGQVGWTNPTRIILSSPDAYQGGWVMKYDSATSPSSLISFSNRIYVEPGESYKFSGYLRASPGASGSFHWQARWYNSTGAVTRFDNLSVPATTTAWTQVSSILSASPSHVWVQFAPYTNGIGTFYWDQASVTRAATSDIIANEAIDLTKFASGLKPVEIVPSLPSPATPQGRTVFLTTDNKLYRATGSAWTVATDGADIVANSITAGKIEGGAISTTELAANAVTASKLAVGDFSVLNRNWNFEEGDTQWSKESGWSIINSSANAKSGNWVASKTNTTTAALRNTQRVNIEPGETFYAEAYIRHAASSTGTGTKVRCIAYSAAGAEVQYFFGNTIPASTTTYTKSFVSFSIAATGTPVTVDVEVESTITAGTAYADEVRLFRTSNTTLIADGAITTDKITVNTLNADRLLAGTISADKIAANSITASKLAIGDYSVLNRNWDFEEGDTQWTKTTGWAIETSPAVAKSGSYIAKKTGTTSNAIVNNQKVNTEAEETFYAEAYIRHAAGNVGTGTSDGAAVRCVVTDAGGTLVTGGTFTGNWVSPSVTGYTKSSVTVVVPTIAGVSPAALIDVRILSQNVTTNNGIYVDEVRLFRTSNTTLIADGAITTDKITVNTLNADRLLAGTISADKIAANSITASRLLVVDTSNMVQDSMMIDNSSWVNTSGVAWTNWGTSATEDATFRSTRFMKITGASGSYAGFYYSKWMPVEPGQSYYITAQGRSVGGIASGAVYNLEWADDENRTNYTETDYTSYGSDTVADVSVTVTAPAGKRFLRVRFYKQNNTATEVRWGGLIVRRRASSELIVEGSINASKIFAGAVTADKVAAGAITTNKLAVSSSGFNLTRDPAFSDSTAWYKIEGNGAVTFESSPSLAPPFGTTFAKVVNSAGTSPSSGAAFTMGQSGGGNDRPFPITAGRRYKVSIWIRTTSTSARHYVRVYWYDANTTLNTTSATLTALSPNTTGSENFTLTAANTWQRFTWHWDAPANAVSALPRVWGCWNASPNTSYFNDFRVEEFIGGELVVDGTITASKLIADSITARELAISNDTTGGTGIFFDSSPTTGPKIDIFNAGVLRVRLGRLT